MIYICAPLNRPGLAVAMIAILMRKLNAKSKGCRNLPLYFCSADIVFALDALVKKTPLSVFVIPVKRCVVRGMALMYFLNPRPFPARTNSGAFLNPVFCCFR